MFTNLYKLYIYTLIYLDKSYLKLKDYILYNTHLYSCLDI